ncbi:F-box protein-like protein [Tanacetum coccineum]|uniref:F-box protein-like protein n=1 Tax=Tanacetum coccineum TaxID=301880 RepID=A0ABQ5A752_9ASTR
MSDNISFNIQTKIIKRVSDVKSLLRLRSVSKQWKSFIDSPQFIAGYGARKTQPHTLLLRYQEKFQVKYLSVNNDTLTQQQDLVPNASTLMKHLRELEVIGYSRGLLCLYGTCTWSMFVLWNPSIRRSVGIVHGIFGFAVCPVTNEPTIVKYSYPWIVEVYTLSSKRWTVIQCSKPCKSIQFHERSHGRSQVVIGSCIYRVSYETILLQYGYYTHQYMIVSFDLNAKEFKAIEFPDTITNQSAMPARLFISKLRESLVLCLPNRQVGVWKMEHDCSFTKLFTFNTPERAITKILGFRKNYELVLEIQQFGTSDSTVEVYEPWSRNVIKSPICGQRNSFFITSYKETLLLLDHLDSSVYYDDCKVLVLQSDMLSHHGVTPL